MKDNAPKRSRKKSPVSASSMKDKVTHSIAQQVAGFIRRYRPALESLAKNAER
jgi:hypothetical protein